MLITGCEPRPRAAGSYLSRPAIAADGRVAFTGGGRIWIADAAAAGHARRASALPLDWPADRPRWLRDEPGLAMSVWFEPWQADLALWTGTQLERLTNTPEDELLDDVSPAGKLLFERGGSLWQADLERPGTGSVRLAPAQELTPGRDGCYSPDGKHVAFVRGHESDPLGIWRQGYVGGDDSEVYFLSLEWMSVIQLTDTPDNDECPVPLDDGGRRFIVCRERGGAYRPWIVEVITTRKHRVRRLPMPEGPWPVLFPAIRPLPAQAPGDTSLALELWVEADGGLMATEGAVQPTKLVFPKAAPVKIDLDEHGLHAGAGGPAGEEAEEGGEEAEASSAGRLSGGAARELTLALTRAITRSPLAAPRWQAVAPADRRRILALLRQTWSERERTELIQRLLGRLALAGCDYVPPGGVPRARTGLPELTPSGEGSVQDLRGVVADSGDASASASTWCAGIGDRRGIVLIDEKTAGVAEILAAELKARRCATLIGRPTAGLAMTVESDTLPNGAVLTMPVAPVKLSTGASFPPTGVLPDQYLPLGTSQEVWQAVVAKALGVAQR